ncbi:A disintegrin and metalloproteinase with thrombospondin motifs 9-like [Ischnura elegans]|uniref:A disintegrin and metalloproteinase with thrombospondin motifs 9-like n=1 Tax=Ischnura elegans TaxID=197161 RepID=UPI001ED8B8F5|nr:A disintegrin and metalloproteinase with thrombospondin motifs 9-like [Ischnura elegans]
MTFARQIHGTRDYSYSSLDYPQGRFSINLKGTGLRVHSSIGRGSGAAVHVSRKDDGQSVVGRCRGKCGACHPADEVASMRWRWPPWAINNIHACVFRQGQQEDVAQPLNTLKSLSSCMNVIDEHTPLERWHGER